MPLSRVPPASPPDQAIILFHDARAVHDIASLRPEEYRAQSRPAWVLARVSPDPDSGASSVPGAYVDGKTGQIVQPAGAQAVVMKEGTWKAVATAPQSSQYTGARYSWSERLSERRRSLSPEDYYSPFASGGTILFRPVPEASGINQFGPVRLLFQDWGQYVAPTFDFVQQHPRLFEGIRPSPPEVAQLTNLVSGQNGLLAVLAFRQLILALVSRSDGLAAASSRPDSSDVAAILTYLALTAASTQTEAEQLSERTLTAVRASHELARLRAIGLGCFAAALFNPGARDAVENARKVLEAIRVRLKGLGRGAEPDPYLDLIFEKMSVPQ